MADDDSQLERLQRELYKREESDELTQRSEDVAQLGLRREKLPEAPSAAAELSFADKRDAARKKRKRFLLTAGVIGGLVLLVAAGVAATIWYRVRQNVTAEQIGLTVTGPSEVQAGNEITYTVSYTNKSRVDWENVELSFEVPPGLTVTKTEPDLPASGKFLRRTVGTLKSGESQSFSITGRLLGAENATVIGTATIQLSPENFPSGRFEHTALLSTTITAAPVDLAVVAAGRAAVGERVVATITVTNKSPAAMEGLYLKLNPAVGMELATEDPEFSPEYYIDEGVWLLPRVSSLETVQRTVVLFVEGQPNEQRTLEVEAGLLANGERFAQQKTGAVVTISSAALAIDQTYQNAKTPLVVHADEHIQGTIKYTNSGTSGLKNLVVKAQVVGDSFDPAALKLPAGAYDPSTRTITWTSATVPQLALLLPQQSGEIKYEFSIKPVDQLPATPSSKNSTVVITALVDSPDIVVPVGEVRKTVQDQYVMSVASDITAAADAFYDDGRLGIKSSGPIPPKVGEETTYSVRLRLGSTLNDVGDVHVSAVLPDGVRYTGKNIATVGTVAFEERTGELTWSIPQLAGLQGRATPAADLYFQVAIRPGENQRGQTIPFLNKLVVTGTDLFVDEQLKTELTAFPTTDTAVPGSGHVE